MDPLSIAGLALSGLTTGLSAAMQYGMGQRQSRLELAQAGQQRQALYKEAGTVGQAAVDQALRSSRLYGLAQGIAQDNMRFASQRGLVEENRTRDATDRTIGQQRAFFTSGNMDPSMGSPLALATSAAAQGEADVMIGRARTAQERAEQGWSAYSAAENADYALKTGAKQIDAAWQSAQTRAAGLTTASGIAAQNARMSGIYGAATTLLNTGTSWLRSPDGRSTISSLWT